MDVLQFPWIPALTAKRVFRILLWQFALIDYCLVLVGEDVASDSDLPDAAESLVLSLDFSAAPDVDESLALSLDFSAAPDVDESLALSLDFSPAAPDEDEPCMSLGDSLGDDDASGLGEVRSVPDVPLGVSVVLLGEVCVSPPEEFPPAQAPRINVSPNTKDRAANFLTINLQNISKSF
jgi:hypothetical protein